MKKFVPLAIPLLLLDADLRKCIKVTGRLLRAFLVGAVGTVVGTLVAFLLVPMKNIVGGDKIASALCARHVRTLIIINEFLLLLLIVVSSSLLLFRLVALLIL